MYVRVNIAVGPAEEPVTRDELKAHAGIVDPPDAGQVTLLNARLDRIITAARQKCELYTRRSLITQELEVWYDEWAGPGIIDDLPRGNVQSIDEVAVYDDAGVETVIDSGDYVHSGNVLVFNVMPYFRTRLGLKVSITSGYGDDPVDVPDALKQGILAYAAHLYEHRLGEGPEVRYQAQAKGSLPQSVADLWRPYQIVMV